MGCLIAMGLPGVNDSPDNTSHACALGEITVQILATRILKITS